MGTVAAAYARSRSLPQQQRALQDLTSSNVSGFRTCGQAQQKIGVSQPYQGLSFSSDDADLGRDRHEPWGKESV